MPEPRPLLQNRLDIHDRKQFELKLEYQPTGQDPSSKYLVEMFMFVPASLHVNAETYPRNDFYADIHNYIRFKTPVMDLDDLLSSASSPLVRMERMCAGGYASEADLIYDVKLLCCVFRGALRRFAHHVDAVTAALSREARTGQSEPLEASTRQVEGSVSELLRRFRAVIGQTMALPALQERTRAALRLVDEYMSLSVEQFFRKAVADMDELPRCAPFVDLRKEMMAVVVREEDYRRSNKLASVLSSTSENEEYMQRVGFLKKFCMNILFLSARRATGQNHWNEMLLAMAAGVAMTFATLVGFWAKDRFTQASTNFFLIAVVAYMLKDRIKESLRKMFTNYAARRLFDRKTYIADPTRGTQLGVCQEKVDYGKGAPVPADIARMRCLDDIAIASQGELAETVIRYQKRITLNTEDLPRLAATPSGVTDIIRINVDRLLRDMDDPDHALEYVDLEQMSVGHIKAAKAYQVDLAFRFTVDDADQQRASLQMVRLVLDRNGIKRMERFEPKPVAAVA